jgi:hypothetical protein
MSALDLLEDAIEKAGLIKPGKPSLLRRVGFLLSTFKNDRNAAVGQYLERRKPGRGYGRKNKLGRYPRARTGTYTGVYATGVNKSETVMDAIEALDEAIEKARGMIPRGGSSKLARRLAQQGAKARAKGGDAKEVKRFSALGTLDNRRRGKAFGVGGYQPGKGYGSVTRRGVYKSTDAPTALDVLDEAIEKARGLIRGGSKRMARVANRHADKKYEGKGRADTPKGYSRASKLQQYTSLRASGWKSVRAGSPWSRDTVTPRRSK